ncbi:MAG: bpX6 domain-containing protein [Polyangiaceae bacterium]
MSSVRPRLLSYRGVMSAMGVVIDASICGEATLRRRAISLWAPGATLQRVGHRLIVRFASPRTLRVEGAEGIPLVAATPKGPLVGAPFSRRELEAIGAPNDAVVLASRGGVDVITASEGDLSVDIASWLDVSSFTLLSVQPLGVPKVARVVFSGEPARRPREVFAEVVPPSPEVDAMLKSLREAQAQPDAIPNETRGPSWLMRTLGTVARAISSWLERPRSRPSNALPAPSLQSPPPATAPSRALVVVPGGVSSGSSLGQRVSEAMRSALARFLVSTQLAEAMSRRQAEYMQETMDLFEKGDFSNALRRAIPLAEGGGEIEVTPSFALPTPRSDLAIHGNRPRGASTLISSENVYERLRALYQQAFEKLEREGKIEEAAFVLAELLGKSEESVAFLERHGKLKLAAEVAEARGLPAGLVVRQLYLAGMRDRAIKLARYKDAFADAVLRLESSGKASEAVELRVAWAKSLAFSGQLLAAVDVIWPAEQHRSLAEEWLNDVADFGGPPASRALVRLLSITQDRSQALSRIEALLNDGGSSFSERAALLDALATTTFPEPLNDVQPILRRAARAAMIDMVADSPERPSFDRVRALVTASNDAVLRADLPLVATVGALPPIAKPRRVNVDPLDVGLLAVHDAVALPDGRVVVALGERGVWFLTQDGRTITRFDLPATSLVAGPSGVIALAQRGDVWKLSRINLLTRRSAPWLELRLSCWDCSFDGSVWFVGIDDAVVAIDAHSDDAEAAWRLPRCGGEIRAIRHDQQQLSFLTRAPADERWTLTLPSHTVSSRVSASIDVSKTIERPHRSGWASVDGDGSAAILGLNNPVGAHPGVLLPEVWLLSPGSRSVQSPTPNATTRADSIQAQLCFAGPSCRDVIAPIVATSGVVLATLNEAGARVDRVPRNATAAEDEITLGAARDVFARLDAQRLVVGDDRGRVLVIDVASGRLITSIRVGR